MPYFVKVGYLRHDITPEQVKELEQPFTQWLTDIRSTGKLAISGGWDEEGKAGMTLLEADSLEQAKEILDTGDPFNKLLDRWYIHSWTVLEPEKIFHPPPFEENGIPLSLAEFEKRHIQAVLDFCDWNKEKAAELLELSIKKLNKEIHKHGLTQP